MDNYITLDMDKSLNETAGDKIRMYRADYNNIPSTISRLCRLLLVHQVDYIVNLSDFYSYGLIGKLTALFQLQEFSQRNLI
jgi:hypothetical protein